MMTPLVEDDEVIGVVSVSCREPHHFSAKKIDQVSSLANQALIAIRNARLFNDTREALERQTASAAVLQVIGQSMADARPVYEAILRSCERFFADAHMGITLSGADGKVYLAAHRGPVLDLAAFKRMYPIPLAGSATSASIAQRRVRQWPDVDNDPDVPTLARRSCLIAGRKALVFAPLVWGQRVIGALFVGRARVGPFSDKDIAMTVEANRPGTEGRYLGPHEMQAQMPACCEGPG